VRAVDALVVGAGPAGLACATLLARRGLTVCAIDKREAPLDKACGEGVMPAGVRALAALGVEVGALRAAPFVGVRFIDGARETSGRFASGPGLGVRRTALSTALRACAEKAGAELRFDCALERFTADTSRVRAQTSQGELEARVLIGADGLGSRVRAASALAAPLPTRRRFGMRRHFRLAPWSEYVEVHWSEGVEAFVTPVARDEVGIALLWSGSAARYDELLTRFPALAMRVRGAEPASEVRGAGPFWQRARRRCAGNSVALLGDAAGYTDAVTGEGITLSLLCANALADVIARGAPLAEYERAWARATRAHRAIAALLGFGVAHPRARRAAFRALSAQPRAFEILLRVAASEEQPWRS